MNTAYIYAEQIEPVFVRLTGYNLAMLNKADIDGGGTTGGTWYQDTILSDLFPNYKQVVRVLGGQMAIEYGNVELDVHRFVVTSVNGLKVKVGGTEGTIWNTLNLTNVSQLNNDAGYLQANDLDGFIYDVTYNSSAHTITFYQQNQPNIVVDLPIEQLIKGVQLVGNDLVFTFEDGSTVTVPLNTLLVGVVKSVNGLTPNSQGEIVLQITDIPNLSSELSNKIDIRMAGLVSNLTQPEKDAILSKLGVVNNIVQVLGLSGSTITLSNGGGSISLNIANIGGLQTALDGKANANGNNITNIAQWKTSLGFLDASDVPTILGGYFKHEYTGFINNGSASRTNQSWFDYNAMGAGFTAGVVASFDGLSADYRLEIFGAYSAGNDFCVRTRNGDTGTWNPARYLWHNGNFDPNTKADLSFVNNNFAIRDGSNLTNIANWQSVLGITTALSLNLQQVTNNGASTTHQILSAGGFRTGNTSYLQNCLYSDGIFRIYDHSTGWSQKIATGGVLASDNYADANLIPANGIYSKGTIATSSHGTSADWNSKVSNLNNATGIGFANGSFSGLPYFYHPTGGAKFVVSVEYLNAQDFASVTYVTNAINNAVANIPVHNGQLTVNTTADLVGGFTYLPSGNLTTTLGLSTAVLNAIADGVTAYSYGNHATQGYLKITDLAPYETTVSVNNKLTAKQDKLIAGANVSIVGNTISATDTDTVTRIGVWGGNYTSGDINFTATGAATIVKNGNNINIDVTNSGGIPNPGVEVLNFSPGSHVIDNQLAITIVRCTSSGTYAFDLQPGKYDGDEICITTCGYEYSVGGELLSMCGTSSFGSSTASRWIWADQLAKWVQVG